MPDLIDCKSLLIIGSMKTSESVRIWAPLFAALCLGLAAVDVFDKAHPIQPIVSALLVLASAPWSLPWFTQLVQSLKVGGVELNFREQVQQKLDEQQQKIDEQGRTVAAVAEHGVGGGGGGGSIAVLAVSHASKAAPDRGSSALIGGAAEQDDSDPNKGQFGGKAVAGGWRLSADVKRFPGSERLFMIHAVVAGSDALKPLVEGTEVVFYLHPTFSPRLARRAVKGGVAVMDCVAWGAFTLGVVVEEIRLELDLGSVAGVPTGFVV